MPLMDDGRPGHRSECRALHDRAQVNCAVGLHGRDGAISCQTRSGYPLCIKGIAHIAGAFRTLLSHHWTSAPQSCRRSGQIGQVRRAIATLPPILLQLRGTAPHGAPAVAGRRCNNRCVIVMARGAGLRPCHGLLGRAPGQEGFIRMRRNGWSRGRHSTDARALPYSCDGAGAPVFQLAFHAPGNPRARGTPGFQPSPWPRVVDEFDHTRLQSPRTADCVGVPRAVFEACSATTPEERRPGTGGQLFILRW